MDDAGATAVRSTLANIEFLTRAVWPGKWETHRAAPRPPAPAAPPPAPASRAPPAPWASLQRARLRRTRSAVAECQFEDALDHEADRLFWMMHFPAQFVAPRVLFCHALRQELGALYAAAWMQPLLDVVGGAPSETLTVCDFKVHPCCASP